MKARVAAAVVVVALVAVVTGVADAQTTPDRPEARLEVDTAIEGAGPWTASFGASPQRTLVVTVRNVSDAAVRHPALAVTIDDGGGTPRTVAARTLDALGAGDEVTERISVGLGGFAWGASTLRVEVAGAGTPVAAESYSSTYPWALVAIALVTLQAVLLRIRNRIRRRLAVVHEPLAAAPPPEPLALPAPVEVRDLSADEAVVAEPEPEPEPDPVTIEPDQEAPVPVDDHDDLLREELARYRDLTTSVSEAVAQTRRTVDDATAAADQSVRRAISVFEMQVAMANAAIENALATWRTEVATICDELQREAAEARATQAEAIAAADAVTASLLDAVRVATERLDERVPDEAPPLAQSEAPPLAQSEDAPPVPPDEAPPDEAPPDEAPPDEAPPDEAPLAVVVENTHNGY